MANNLTIRIILFSYINMRKIKPSIILYYIAILTTIVMFILITVYIVKYNNKSRIEGFETMDLGGLGELTPDQATNYKAMLDFQESVESGDDGAHQIHHDSNFYEIQIGGDNGEEESVANGEVGTVANGEVGTVANGEVGTVVNGEEGAIDKTILTTDNDIHSIGATNICIYKYNDDDDNTMDMECISAGQLGIVRDLPKARREKVCIDEECIDKEDVKLLNGEIDFRLSHNNKVTDLDKCLHLGSVPAQGCLGPPWTFKLHTLKTQDCDAVNEDGSSTTDRFKLFSSGDMFNGPITAEDIGKISSEGTELVQDNIIDGSKEIPKHT
jgi:hypothetical protein